jgi:hypothetical protein
MTDRFFLIDGGFTGAAAPGERLLSSCASEIVDHQPGFSENTVYASDRLA